MPNWCENKVMISAKKEEDMKFFKDKAFKKDKDGAEVFQFNHNFRDIFKDNFRQRWVVLA